MNVLQHKNIRVYLVYHKHVYVSATVNQYTLLCSMIITHWFVGGLPESGDGTCMSGL